MKNVFFTNDIPEILVKKFSALANTEAQGEILTQLTPLCALDKAVVTACFVQEIQIWNLIKNNLPSILFLCEQWYESLHVLFKYVVAIVSGKTEFSVA